MWYSNLKKHLFLNISSTNTDTFVPLLYQYIENRSTDVFSTVVLVTSMPQFQPLHHQRNVCHPVVNIFTWQTFPTINRKHFFMNILCIESFCSQETHNRTLLFSNPLLKHSRHFDYWNQPLNLHMCICYLDCHEAGLCCYLVIHTGNLLHPLQLFYFHLWPIYWLSLICSPSQSVYFLTNHLMMAYLGQNIVNW
jgi:hypothetical protein